MRCGRRYAAAIAGLQLAFAGATTTLICASSADMQLIQADLLGVIAQIQAGLGAPARLSFTTCAAAWQTPTEPGRHTRVT